MSYSDGWFMGFTPELVAGVWVGGEERYIHFNRTRDGQGAEMALPIYAKFMKALYDDPKQPYNQNTRFNFPADINLCGSFVPQPAETIEETVDGYFD